MAAFSPFVPLRVLSSYSMLEGAIDPKAIAKLAKERGFPAIAVCDRNGLYSVPAFASACKDAGIQPLIGTLLAVARPGSDAIDWLALFAQNEAGWLNLCRLVSRAHLDRPLERDPHVALRDLDGYTDGLIALTAAGEGVLVRLLAEGRHDQADAMAERLAALFPGRLYIEVARRGDPAEAVDRVVGEVGVPLLVGHLPLRLVLRDEVVLVLAAGHHREQHPQVERAELAALDQKDLVFEKLRGRKERNGGWALSMAV